jgi:GAF domain-containing protein
MAAAARDAEQLEHLRTALRGSSLCLPLTARGRTVGLLALTRTRRTARTTSAHVLDLARRRRSRSTTPAATPSSATWR